MQSSAKQICSSMLVVALAATAFAGCTGAYNSGISEKGPNTYFLQVRTPSSKGGGDESLRQAQTQADAYCAKSDRESEVTSKEVGPVAAGLFFTCVAK